MSPLYLLLWPPVYLCRILVLIETSSARPKPSNSQLLTIKFRFPDVTEIGVSLLHCQCRAVASSHVNSQGSEGNQFSNIWVPCVPLLDVSGNNLIINISLIFPASFPHPWPWLAGSVCGNVTYLPNCRVYCASWLSICISIEAILSTTAEQNNFENTKPTGEG